MPDLSEHQSAQVTKMLLIGESGTGKTGALASLAEAGYNLRILDLDNGIDILYSLIMLPDTSGKFRYPKARERIKNGAVTYQTLTEPMKNVGGKVVPAKAVVWESVVRLLDRWVEYELDENKAPIKGPDGKFVVRKDLGKISTWGPQDVLVIDSLTRLGDAAYNFDWKLQGKLGIEYTQNEHRRAVWRAQSLVEHLLQMLYDVSVPCNVIVVSHITYVKDIEAQGAVPGEDGDANFPKKGFPSVLGVALSPKVPRYFNSALYTRTLGVGTAAKQQLSTVPLGVVNVKSSAPNRVKPHYPIETGLGDYFRDVRG